MTEREKMSNRIHHDLPGRKKAENMEKKKNK